MVRSCAIKSCHRRSRDDQPLSFFQAGTELKLQLWSQALGMSLRTIDFICHLHFNEADIIRFRRVYVGKNIQLFPMLKSKLREGAEPSIEHQFVPSSDSDTQKALEHQYKMQKSKLNEGSLPSIENQVLPTSEPVNQKADESQCDLISIELSEPEEAHIDLFPFLKEIKILPQHWFYHLEGSNVVFMRCDPNTKTVLNHLVLDSNYSFSVIFSNNETENLNVSMSSPDQIFDFLKSVEKWRICVGTQFLRKGFSPNCKGVLVNNEAYIRQQMNPRCKACRELRHQLQGSKTASLPLLEKKSARNRKAEYLEAKCKRLKASQNVLKEKLSQLKVRNTPKI